MAEFLVALWNDYHYGTRKMCIILLGCVLFVMDRPPMPALETNVCLCSSLGVFVWLGLWRAVVWPATYPAPAFGYFCVCVGCMVDVS